MAEFDHRISFTDRDEQKRKLPFKEGGISSMPSFDILSYPREVKTAGFIFNLDTTLPALSPNARENDETVFNLGTDRQVRTLRKLVDRDIPVALVSTFQPETLGRILATVGLSEAQRGKLVHALLEDTTLTEDHLRNVAATMSVPIENLMVVIDNKDSADRALNMGMGVTQINHPDGVDRALRVMVDPRSETDVKVYDEYPLYTDLSYPQVSQLLYEPGQIQAVGFVGRTGAGKSTTIRRVMDSLNQNGGDSGMFQIDAFFKKSRAERKAWLNESGISDAERAERRRVANWWDLDFAADSLDRVRSGEHVHLEGMYDMEQGGEKVGVVDVNPNPSGYTVFVEGTALLLPQLSSVIDVFVCLNTHDAVRAQSLMERNLRHGYTEAESHARKALTDNAETGDHISQPLRFDRYQQQGLVVLDNTARGDSLTLLPPYIPQK